MSREPRSARRHAHDLSRGIDPDVLGHDAVIADRARAAEPPGPRALDAGCIRDAYAAIADAGGRGEHGDRAVLVSLGSGARAAADAARVAEEIGAGAGEALRAAARAWSPHVVAEQGQAWRTGLRAFAEVCSAGDEADDRLVVRAVASAAEALAADGSATGRAARVFSRELAARDAEGGRLAPSWAEAAGVTASEAPDPVFQVVIDAVGPVLRRDRRDPVGPEA